MLISALKFQSIIFFYELLIAIESIKSFQPLWHIGIGKDIKHKGYMRV